MHGATIKIEITPPVSIRNANQLTLFGEIIDICEENYRKHHKYAL